MVSKYFKRRKLTPGLIAITLLGAVTVHADNDDIVVRPLTGEADKTVFAIDGLSQITFEGDEILFHTVNGSVTSFRMDELSDLHFDDVATSLASIAEKEKFLTVSLNPATNRLYLHFAGDISLPDCKVLILDLWKRHQIELVTVAIYNLPIYLSLPSSP